MLQPSELALDGRAAPIELLPAQRRARDQRVQAARLDPDRCGFALAGRAAPLARAALAVRSCEPPVAVLARRRLVRAALHVGRPAKRDDRAAVALLAALVDRFEVVALVHRACLSLN